MTFNAHRKKCPSFFNDDESDKSSNTSEESLSDHNSSGSDDVDIVRYDGDKEITIKKSDLFNNIPNKKILLCYSTIHQNPCSYGNHCTYAHSLDEQCVKEDKQFFFQIILDANLFDFFSWSNPKTVDLYRTLFKYCDVCVKCERGECVGGYNCKFGVHNICLKICKNDLLTGDCKNKILDINVPQSYIDKIEPSAVPPTYVGCAYGHHLTSRGLVPYYSFLNKKKRDNTSVYHSVRYIGTPSPKYPFSLNKGTSSTSNSGDDEIEEWFKDGLVSDVSDSTSDES